MTLIPFTLFALLACGEEEDTFGGVSPRVEDCADGVDNDGNGLADCEDSACAAEGVCIYEGAVLEVQVTSGDELVFQREFERKGWDSSVALSVYGVTGTLAILHGSQITSCDWGFDSARGSDVWDPNPFWGSYLGDVSLDHSGWTIDASCPFEPEHILPALTLGSGTIYGPGDVPWYVGSGTSFFSSTTYYEAVAYASVVGWALSQWTQQPIEDGGVHTVQLD